MHCLSSLLRCCVGLPSDGQICSVSIAHPPIPTLCHDFLVAILVYCFSNTILLFCFSNEILLYCLSNRKKPCAPPVGAYSFSTVLREGLQTDIWLKLGFFHNKGDHIPTLTENLFAWLPWRMSLKKKNFDFGKRLIWGQFFFWKTPCSRYQISLSWLLAVSHAPLLGLSVFAVTEFEVRSQHLYSDHGFPLVWTNAGVGL